MIMYSVVKELAAAAELTQILRSIRATLVQNQQFQFKATMRTQLSVQWSQINVGATLVQNQ